MVKQSQTLAVLSSSNLEQFLVELVNLSDDSAAVKRFVKRFANYGVADQRVVRAVFHLPDDFPFEKVSTMPFEEFLREYQATKREAIVPYLRNIFRATWHEPDSKVREWAWAILRTDLARVSFSSQYLQLVDQSGQIRLPKPPPLLPLETAFEFLLRHYNRVRHCPNPDCPAPYFFAKRHTQRYCSEKCAQNGERATKRKWWAEHGTEWREERKPDRSTKIRKTTKKGSKRK